MGKFAENLNLGKRVRPPCPNRSILFTPSIVPDDYLYFQQMALCMSFTRARQAQVACIFGSKFGLKKKKKKEKKKKKTQLWTCDFDNYWTDFNENRILA